MDVMLTYAREEMDALDSAKVMKLIERHINEAVPQFANNMKYYLGEHAILEKSRQEESAPNAKTVCNHAKDISDTASGYFLGNPITYTRKGQTEGNEAAFDSFVDAMNDATTDDDDQENALMLSICGKTYEYIYQAEDEPILQEKPIDPQNAFLVYDQSIEHKELFGVYYYKPVDDEGEEEDWFDVLVMTDSELRYYRLEEGSEDIVLPYNVVQHQLGYVPLVEYKNNRFAIGDFEQQIGLIDAYNTMTSDRINDKEQFIDAVLVLYGALLADDETATGEAMSELQTEKLLQLPSDARAEYLVRQLDESGMEVLRDALKEDIYTFSHVPNLTDENFAGNSSGVAMEYKLLGLEMLTKTKERWYRRGLRKRIKIFLRFIGLKGSALEEKDIEPVFTRSLPKNLLEISQIISNLSGEVSSRTLIAQIPFVKNAEEELEALKAEKEENKALFGLSGEAGEVNEEPEDLEDGEDE